MTAYSSAGATQTVIKTVIEALSSGHLEADERKRLVELLENLPRSEGQRYVACSSLPIASCLHCPLGLVTLFSQLNNTNWRL